MSGTRCPDFKSSGQRMDCRQRTVSRTLDGRRARTSSNPGPARMQTVQEHASYPPVSVWQMGLGAPTCVSYPTVEIKPQSQLMMEVKIKMMMSMSRKMKRIINSRQTLSLYRMYFIILFIISTNQGCGLITTTLKSSVSIFKIKYITTKAL